MQVHRHSLVRGSFVLRVVVAIAVAIVVATVSPAWAQRGPIDGYVSVTTDYLPNEDDTLELRARLFVERQVDAGPNLRFSFSGWAEGLVADRAAAAAGDGRESRAVRDAVARPHEAYVDLRAGRVDLRAGLSNVVWGRLDEVQPSDVINPLDISRYLFEGRNEARLPVPMVRARWVQSEALTLEGVWVPLFRRGRADFLDEDRSPFSLLTARDLCRRYSPCPPGPIATSVDRDEPVRTLRSSQGGLRLGATTGRVDWSVSAYRGFEPFGVVTLAETPTPPTVSPPTLPPRTPPPTLPPPGAPPPGAPVVIALVETFPRFTMIASDVEAVRGRWTMRGEVAAFLDETLQAPDAPTTAPGRSIEAGGSVERKAGDYRFNGAVLLQHRRASSPAAGWSDTDVSLVTGAQRSFARDTRRLLLFGVWNLADSAGFLRTIGAWSLRDDLWLEGSVGWFFGEGTDTLSRFGTRDFAYVRLKAYF